MPTIREAFDALYAATPRLPGEQEHAYRERITTLMGAQVGEDQIVIDALQQAQRTAAYQRNLDKLAPPLRRLYERQVAAAGKGGGMYRSVVITHFGTYQGQEQTMGATLELSYGDTPALNISMAPAYGRITVPVKSLADLHGVADVLRAFVDRLDAVLVEIEQPAPPAGGSRG